MAIKRRGARIKGQHRTLRARSASRHLTSAGRAGFSVSRFPVGWLRKDGYQLLGYPAGGPTRRRGKRTARIRSGFLRSNALLWGPLKRPRRSR